MQVQVLLSAPKPIKTNRRKRFVFLFFVLNKGLAPMFAHCRQTLFATCILQLTRLSFHEAIAITLVSLATSPVVRTKRDPVEPERFDRVFLFKNLTILGVHFKSYPPLFFRAVDIFADLCDDNHHEWQMKKVCIFTPFVNKVIFILTVIMANALLKNLSLIDLIGIIIARVLIAT